MSDELRERARELWQTVRNPPTHLSVFTCSCATCEESGTDFFAAALRDIAQKERRKALEEVFVLVTNISTVGASDSREAGVNLACSKIRRAITRLLGGTQEEKW